MAAPDIQLDEATSERIRRVADQRGVSPEQLVANLLTGVEAGDGTDVAVRATPSAPVRTEEERAKQSRRRRSPAFRRGKGPSTAASLLTFAGTWEGDDLEACLRQVYEARSKFYP